MSTIKEEIKISGKCLMDGKESNVTLFPCKEKGVRFFLNGETLQANVQNVISTMNCVVLGNAKAQIRLIEHFMAALAFCRVDSLDVCIDAPELPILDGSAKQWVEEILKTGVTHKEQNNIEFAKPITFKEENTLINLIPSESFKISYMVNFEHPELSNRWFEWNLDNKNNEIIEARTFGYLKDLEKFQKAGMALGASIDNTVGLTNEGYTVELRSSLEPIKHKILDIIGDLYLSGINPLDFKAHILVKEAGHKTHVEFAKTILREIG